MKKIAITGNIACGKSTAYELIKGSGFPIVDCDDIVKKLYGEKFIVEKINRLFPDVIESGKINLKNLSNVIFSDKENKKNLENLIYPYVIKEIDKFHKNFISSKITFVVVPQLFEAEFEKYFDKIILITADENTRKERLINRKTTLSDYAEQALYSQLSQELKMKKSDFIIENNSTTEEFKDKLSVLINSL